MDRLLQNGLRGLVVVSSTGGGLVHIIYSWVIQGGDCKFGRQRLGTGGLWSACARECECYV